MPCGISVTLSTLRTQDYGLLMGSCLFNRGQAQRHSPPPAWLPMVLDTAFAWTRSNILQGSRGRGPMDKVAVLTTAFYKTQTTQYRFGPLWQYCLESYPQASYRPEPVVGYQAFKTQGRFVHNVVLCTGRYLRPRKDSANYLVLVEEREQGGWEPAI